MTGRDVQDEALRWLRYATEDIQEAERLVASGSFVPRHVCFLSQQAAEKALKAVLVFLQIEFPWTHDLESLAVLVPEGWSVKSSGVPLEELSEWAVEARYPGAWPDPTMEQASSAAAGARSVVGAVVADLASRGVSAEQVSPSPNPG